MKINIKNYYLYADNQLTETNLTEVPPPSTMPT